MWTFFYWPISRPDPCFTQTTQGKAATFNRELANT